MSVKLSPTTFATGIKDNLAPVDVYKQKSATSPIDDVTADVVIDPNTLQGLMGGNLAAPISLIASYSKANGISVNASTLLQGIVSANPSMASALGSVNASTAAALSVVSGSANILATIGSISATIKNTDLSNLSGVAGLIAGISGTAYPVAFTDISGLTILSTNLLNQANQLGIPNAYAQISIGLSKNPLLLQAVTKNVLPSIAHNSNTNMLANVANGPSRYSIKATSPSFISSFASNYTIPPGTSQQQLPAIGASISSSFTKIDPNWNKTTKTDGRQVNNNNVYSSASSDFLKVMKAAQASADVLSIVNLVKRARQTPAQAAANPITDNWPQGTTITNDTSTPGVSIETVVTPDGKTTKIITNADGSVLRTESGEPTQYLPQFTSDGQPVVNDASLASDASFLTDTLPTTTADGALNELNNTYPIGSIQIAGTDLNGNNCVNTTMPDGSCYFEKDLPSGTVNIEQSPVTDPDSLTKAIAGFGPGDPLASGANAIASNPLAIGGVMDDFTNASINESISSSLPSLMSMDASEALKTCFPNTSLSDMESFT